MEDRSDTTFEKQSMVFYDYPIINTEANLPIYLLNMGLQYCQDHILRPKGYPLCQILFCKKGSGTLLFDGMAHEITGNTAFFLPPDYPHEYFPNEEEWDIHWVVFAGNGIPQILCNIELTHPAVFKLPETNRLELLFFSMHEAIQSDELFGNTRASGILYSFLLEFNKLIREKSYGFQYNPVLIKAVNYIAAHYRENCSLEQLCSYCKVTKQHMCLLFRNSLHTSPMEYLTKKRLQEAKLLLSTTNLSVKDIAEAVGFHSTSYFCKQFKHWENMTTTQFMNSISSL